MPNASAPISSPSHTWSRRCSGAPTSSSGLATRPSAARCSPSSTSTIRQTPPPASPARYSELVEIGGIVPAPYSARHFWVAAERWDVFTTAEWHRELHAAHAVILAKLPSKVVAAFALPAAQQKRLIAARRKLLAAKAKK